LGAQAGDPDDLFPAAFAEPTRAFTPMHGEMLYFEFDFGVVRVVHGVGEKSRRFLVIPGLEAVARVEHERFGVKVIDHVCRGHVSLLWLLVRGFLPRTPIDYDSDTAPL
jgi:hypothetical protein